MIVLLTKTDQGILLNQICSSINTIPNYVHQGKRFRSGGSVSHRVSGVVSVAQKKRMKELRISRAITSCGGNMRHEQAKRLLIAHGKIEANERRGKRLKRICETSWLTADLHHSISNPPRYPRLVASKFLPQLEQPKLYVLSSSREIQDPSLCVDDDSTCQSFGFSCELRVAQLHALFDLQFPLGIRPT